MSLTVYVPQPAQSEGQVDVYARVLNRRYVKSTDVKLPKVSIITVTWNSSATISATLDCVARQTYPNIEHIVVDGASSDNTLAIISQFSHVSKCISEKDNGIYNAMNKGLRMATGDIIAILNSDDVYASDQVIEQVVNVFQREKTDTVYGDLHYVDAITMSRVLRAWTSGGFKPSKFRFGWMPPHPSFFVKRDVYEKVGLFNDQMRSAADYEMMLRILYKHRCTTAYLPKVLVKMRAGGSSNGAITKRLKANQEDRDAWKVNGLKPYFFTLYLKPARKIFQYMNREQLRRVPILNFFL